MFAISFVVPVYIDRYLYFASPAFYLLVAMAATVQLNSWQPVWLLPVGRGARHVGNLHALEEQWHSPFSGKGPS
jgi:hypothetical protein